ncbi:tryptophan halogenase family protein [Sphingomonas astaxanthinifaciens]|uniref:Tryptophan halogenase n=1 Tax=Sphingomonas astaxanthinifaciens DSM 22298 TaxID=1123267 RepID=A0ABQ5Z654_9SPHN|nr:tryptophan halogenase family protein [Sphingomonas astaxanthinifaciens]GLR48188.1 tryptophan halogenase [Sphingomonas astaxanthinifaciens DSM 22298]
MKIVIVGGGSAGWMAAAALGRIMGGQWPVELVESDAIGTVGVGEATIPQIQLFNGVIGLDEAEFVARTKGSFKLGIEFVGWHGGEDARYMHAFGQVGRDLGLIAFHHYWLQARARGDRSRLEDYSQSGTAAFANRFTRDDTLPNAPLGGATYAYHFDAGLYAAFLREKAEGFGVVRHEGRITEVAQDPETGNVAAVVMEDGRRIAGDLFIDCSGFAALLIGKTMGVEFIDWSEWLPMNRALAVPCESVEPLTPYTRSTARKAGWQWRIPLQHRIGNGHVYCSDYLGDEEAAEILLANLDGKPLADPRPLRFTTGRRRECWKGNVVALGLASGFLEPLESTSIHLVQSGLKHLIDLLPHDRIDPADVAAFNAKTAFDYEAIRDFIILHYHANDRPEPFWQRCREMRIPDSLAEKIETFRAHGRIFRFNEELFTELGWLQVMTGQGIVPRSYHPLADAPGDDNVDRYLASIRELVQAKVQRMPPHRDYLNQLCGTPAEVAA